MAIFWDVKQCNLTDFHQHLKKKHTVSTCGLKRNYQTTWYHVTENSNVHTHHQESLKVHIKISVCIHSWYTLITLQFYIAKSMFTVHHLCMLCEQ